VPSAPRNHKPAAYSGKQHAPRRDADQRTRKRFYDSALWQHTREAKLRRDPLCQCCACEGRAVQAEHVDHWTPLAQGGHPTADDNLVSMCRSCHSRKTLAEQAGTALPNTVPSRPRCMGIA
jgi:5-methylcytosine-specific restriction protein A